MRSPQTSAAPTWRFRSSGWRRSAAIGYCPWAFPPPRSRSRRSPVSCWGRARPTPPPQPAQPSTPPTPLPPPRRSRRLALDLPASPLEAAMSAEVWEQVYQRLAELIAAHRTTLIFVNTRRLAERVTRQLSDRIGTDQVTAHHGSLAKEQRLDA